MCSRSRSPPTTVNDRVTQLEEQIKGLQQNVNELLSERAWWTWWYNHWGKWLQNMVMRLRFAALCRALPRFLCRPLPPFAAHC